MSHSSLIQQFRQQVQLHSLSAGQQWFQSFN